MLDNNHGSKVVTLKGIYHLNMDHILDNTILEQQTSWGVVILLWWLWRWMSLDLGDPCWSTGGVKCYNVCNLISRLKHVAVHCFTNFSVGLKFSKIKVYINNLGGGGRQNVWTGMSCPHTPDKLSFFFFLILLGLSLLLVSSVSSFVYYVRKYLKYI